MEMATAPAAILTQLHALPRPEQWSGTVGYSPKTGKGTKNGDPAAVGIVQRALCLNGLDKIVGAVDSKFGKKTLLAIQTFQQQAHLSVDGIVGRITWKRLWEGTSFVVSGAGVNSAPAQAELAAINIPVAGGPTLPTAQPQTGASSKWVFAVTQGRVYDPNGTLFNSESYAGDPSHFNKIEFENLQSRGPLPRGLYKMVSFHSVYQGKANTIKLLPVNVPNLYGRSGFLIHGSNNPAGHTGSEGCIIVPANRRKIWEDFPNARFIEVVSTFAGD
jgi:peptidoglycan hydrolase-like protein with peptidoglycan-binding domain